MKNNDVIIAYATNDAFALPLSVSIESIIETGDPERHYCIFVLYHSLLSKNIALLESIGHQRTPVQCINISHLIDEYVMYEKERFTREIYFRLLISEVLPQYDKVLYLDSDVVALEDVGELYDTELDGAIMGGVRDVPGERGEIIERELQLSLDTYINSGVLLIDTKRFNNDQIKKKCLSLLSRNKELISPDQDAINLICKDKIKILDNKWNVFWQMTLKKEMLESPQISILHYVTSQKPWNTLGYAQADYFWQYAKKTKGYCRICSEILNFPLELNNYIDLQGMILGMCRDGNLGLRYIIKLFMAWMAFKLKEGQKRGK
jgi:lipopolysaccharide biosynthesis glycosyltransferase